MACSASIVLLLKNCFIFLGNNLNFRINCSTIFKLSSYLKLLYLIWHITKHSHISHFAIVPRFYFTIQVEVDACSFISILSKDKRFHLNSVPRKLSLFSAFSLTFLHLLLIYQFCISKLIDLFIILFTIWIIESVW